MQGFVFWCNALFQNEVPEEIKAEKAVAELLNLKSEQRAEAALSLLQRELSTLKRLEKKVEAKEQQRLESARSKASLPNAESSDRILRYEKDINREFYKAMDQLERLQRRCQGEHVPPPITVDVSTEK